MSQTIKLSLLSVALLSSLNAEQTVKLQALTITSTAIQTDELKSTDAVEVYTQEDIEKAHVQNVYEFLNQQTSVTTMPSYGNPFTQLIDIHGYGTSNGQNNIVININGRKLNNIDNVPQLLASISPSSISRIEIIKSGGIVMAGDGANAGVINITTKKNNDKDISLYIGTQDTSDGSFYVGHSTDKLSISANGEAYRTGGTRTIDSDGNKDESSIYTGGVSIAYTPIQELELRAGADFAKTDVIYGGTMTQAQYDEDSSQFAGYTANLLFDTETFNLGATYFINDELSIKIDANSEKKESDYVPSYGSSEYTYNSAKASLDYVTQMMALSVGVDIFNGEREQSTNTTSKDNIAAFAMSEFYLGQSTIKAGYRYEEVSYDYNEPGKNLNQDDSLHGVELGYNYLITQEQSFFLNYAHSYQAPVIDMFFSTVYAPPAYTPETQFNDFIEPMEADSITLGFNYIKPNNKLKVSIYYIALKDEIYLSKAYPGDFGTNTNIDKSHKYGLDFYDKWIINPAFNLVFNYNYVQATIDEEIGTSGEDYADNNLPGASEHSAKATISYLANKNTSLSLTQAYRSEAYAADDFGNNFTQKQDAYYSTGISATYAKDNWEIFAKINNIFEKSNGLWVKDDAIYPVNFARTAILGLKLKL